MSEPTTLRMSDLTEALEAWEGLPDSVRFTIGTRLWLHMNAARKYAALTSKGKAVIGGRAICNHGSGLSPCNEHLEMAEAVLRAVTEDTE